jgi:hypothetical protein
VTGAWRSAAFAVALAAAGAVAAQPNGSASVRQSGDAIVFDGRIDAASAQAFQRLLEQDPAIRRLVIHSLGGLVAPALDVGEAVFRRGLDVEVDRACLSSCANYVFPAGRHKLLSGPAAVGWHGNMAHVLYRAQHGEEHWSDADLAQARALARREEAFYRRIGVDGFVCWFGKIPPYDVDEFYTLSPEDMARFGIRDVTVRADAPTGPEADVRTIAVDAGTLEAIRPAVPLSE